MTSTGGRASLELAAGPGAVGLLAASRIAPRGRLISTDFSEAMLDVGRRRSAELGLSNVEFRLMDAERVDLEDSSVVGVPCR